MNNKTVTFIRSTFMIILIIMTIIPIVWAFSLAFRSNAEIVSMRGINRHTFYPEHATLQNFLRLFQTVNVPRVFLLTMFVSLSVTALSLILNSLAGYAFARIPFPLRSLLFALLLATLAVPVEILIIPLYPQIHTMGLMNTLTSLIIPFCANAFGIFFMRQFFLGIPRELEEAAMIDGCTRLRTFVSIMIPLAKAVLITLALNIFLQQWDSFLVPVTLISSESKMLLQVAINYIYSGLYFQNYGVLYAGMVIATLPIIIIFLFLQRYYVAGITSTGIKG
ncbi:MAG: carbohydrate ABC transporter permease [Sphaerochaeta sp.]|jgi:multiple sugar transport system permease protein|nr:carbohydrate ABC transporter permease [Sphaerochaeta sp.]MDX9915322.1 carbohydrate ABC transporter permease [Sphaerochaeta sp.]